MIAVNDGRVVKIGKSKRLGRFVMLQDVYGNTYTYAHLGEVSRTYPAPKPRSARRSKKERPPTRDASASRPRPRPTPPRPSRPPVEPVEPAVEAAPLPLKERLFAHPTRPAARAAGGDVQLAETGEQATQGAPLGFDARDFRPKALKKGSRVLGGTILGRLGAKTAKSAPYLKFEIRPAGRGAPRIDPKPILDGWKLLESTAIYRAKGKNPFFGADAETPSIGQLLLLSKEQLVRRVLADRRIEVYGCGTGDIRSGQIDRRVLATMLYLASSGLKPTVTSLKCGHGYLHGLRQRVRALDRHGDGHRRDQRRRDHPRHPGPRLDHRPDDPAPAQAPGHDEAAPDHLPDDLRRRGQHATPWATTTTTSTSAGARSTARTAAPRARSTRCSSPSSGSS